MTDKNSSIFPISTVCHGVQGRFSGISHGVRLFRSIWSSSRWSTSLNVMLSLFARYVRYEPVLFPYRRGTRCGQLQSLFIAKNCTSYSNQLVMSMEERLFSALLAQPLP